jgi:PWI domain
MNMPPPAPAVVAARPVQILLTHVPAFFTTTRMLRDWLLSIGNVRSVVLLSPTLSNSNESESAIKAAASELTVQARYASAVVTLSHADGAAKVLAAVRHVAAQLRSSLHNDDDVEWAQSFGAQPVPPHNPDVPLPPPMVDAETVAAAGETLYAALDRYRQHGQSTTNGGTGGSGSSTAATNQAGDTSNDMPKANGNTATSTTTSNNNDVDDEVDPLEAPAVLEAVRKFREQLIVMQGSKAVARQQAVAEAMAKALPLVRRAVASERAAAAAMANSALSLPPVPLPSLLPMPPPPLPGAHTLPPPPPAATAVLDGPRGVSNKPAWMTQREEQEKQLAQQQQQHLAPASDSEPPTKRIKLEDTAWKSDPTVTSPVVPKAAAAAALRIWMAQRIAQLLGEEEATLIDFVHERVLQQSAVASLLPELSDVLDEDAAPFLQSVLDYCHELVAQQASAGSS